ncbi:MAG: hypothetical protein Q9195_009158 [Heterodermia aff. obscurata]
MDDGDLKLQKASADLIRDFTHLLPNLLRRQNVKTEDLNFLVKLLEPFQEWPQLIDPYLKSIVPDLATAFLSTLSKIAERQGIFSERVAAIPVWRAICVLLYTLCKVRGYKVIVRFFNNEPRYLEPMLSTFNALNANGNLDGDRNAIGVPPSWEERYIVFLWLSHLILTPFDLSSISSGRPMSKVLLTARVGGPDIPDDVPWIATYAISLSIPQLAESSKVREAAKVLLVRVALRPDMERFGLFKILLNWVLSSLKAPSCEAIFSGMSPVYTSIGLLEFLEGLTATADTVVIAPFIGLIFETVHDIALKDNVPSNRVSSSALTRKLIIKILRSVTIHLQNSSCLAVMETPSASYSSDEIVEEVIDHLLNSLADKDTPVRYGASKALSVIAAKLDPAMAADIVEAVVGSLEENVLWDDTSTGKTISNHEKDNMTSETLLRNLTAVNALRWHGLVLTLSQLLFRRSPPPTQLPIILNALILALDFEQRSTTGSSIGTSVRDAACFGMWAIARRYTTQELQAVDTSAIQASSSCGHSTSILQALANELIVAATLDPAGNIRRGASAALQEMIGRHPDTIEQGIAVVQVVDYHAVALRSKAMIEVSIAASALSNTYWLVVLGGLLGWRGVGSPDAQSRRDTATAIGHLSENHLLVVLKKVRQALRSTKDSQIEERHALLLCLAKIVGNLNLSCPVETDKLFDDIPLTQRHFNSPALRPSLTAEAICHLIKAVGRAAHVSPVMNRILKEDLSRRVQELQWSLQHNEDLIIHTATEAMYELFFAMDCEAQKAATQGWMASFGGQKPKSRNCGTLMVLGVAHRHQQIHNQTQADHIRDILLAQTDSVEIESKIWALKNDATAETLRKCLEDHTTDQRGDIGSLVRLEAIKGLDAVLKNVTILESRFIQRLISKLCGLAVEKLDKVRFQAVQCLKDNTMLNHTYDTSSPGHFQHFLYLTTIQELRRNILEDLIITACSGSESVLVAARAALATHVEKVSSSQLEDLCNTLLAILESSLAYDKKPANDRLLIPAMDVWGYLFETGALDRLGVAEHYHSLIHLVKTAHHKSLNVRKLEAAVKIYLGTLNATIFTRWRSEALLQLTGMLLHQYPKIRNAAADALYLVCPACKLLEVINWTERKDIRREDVKSIRSYIQNF